MLISRHSSNAYDECFHTVAWGHVLLWELDYVSPSSARIRLVHEPKKSRQASHRFILHHATLLGLSSVRSSKELTSECFQIRCNGAANEEAEGEQL